MPSESVWRFASWHGGLNSEQAEGKYERPADRLVAVSPAAAPGRALGTGGLAGRGAEGCKAQSPHSTQQPEEGMGCHRQHECHGSNQNRNAKAPKF